LDKDREISIDDGAIFYQEQLRERLEQYQVKTKIFFFKIFFFFSIIETSN
jgi:hypothetical protein